MALGPQASRTAGLSASRARGRRGLQKEVGLSRYGKEERQLIQTVAQEAMTCIADSLADVSPAVQAGVLFAARAIARRYPLSQPSVEAVLAATGAGRSRAYERRDEILALLPSLDHASGRPATTAAAPPAAVTDNPMTEMLRFVMAHPGAVSTGPARNHYSDTARRFVLELRERHAPARPRLRRQRPSQRPRPTPTRLRDSPSSRPCSSSGARGMARSPPSASTCGTTRAFPSGTRSSRASLSCMAFAVGANVQAALPTRKPCVTASTSSSPARSGSATGRPSALTSGASATRSTSSSWWTRPPTRGSAPR